MTINKKILALFALPVVGLGLAARLVLAQNTENYQNNLDTYRSLYEFYRIKSNEFNQYGTYKAEEELIAAAKKMLLARADVWLTYWSMHEELVKTNPGLEPATKETLVNFYKAETDWLKNHKATVATQERRDTLMAEAVKLNAKATQYDAAGSQSTALIYNGKILGIVTKLLSLNQATQERVNAQALDEDQKPQKIRGLQVNKDRLDALRAQLQMYEQEHIDRVDSYTQTLSSIKGELEPFYIEARQLKQVLNELTKGVEW